MNLKKFIAKKFISTILCSALFFIFGIGLVELNRTTKVYASTTNMTEVTVENSNFNNSTSSTYPFSPTGYTQYLGNSTSSTGDLHSSISAGVISLNSDKYSTKFENAKRSDVYDAYVLMIDSQKISTNLGYRSSEFSLNGNSNYIISVDVYTNTANGIANLYLYSKTTTYASISNISSKSCWTTCTFLLSTSDTSTSATIGMYLNGKGVALFDNIHAYEITDAQLAVSLNAVSNSIYTYQNNKVESGTEYISSISGFENKNNSTDKTELTNTEFTKQSASIDNVAVSDGNNVYSTKIYSSEKVYSLFSTKNDFITTKQNLSYRITITAKTADMDGNATLKLNCTSHETDEKSISINSSDWGTYSFYIKGNPTEEAKFKLSFGLGTGNSDLASGSLYISSIKINEISATTFANGTSSETMDLTIHDYKDSAMLSNGDFNDVKIENTTNPYPATPNNWTVTTGKNKQFYGVVNTDGLIFNQIKTEIAGLINPCQDQSDNVLLMYNTDTDTLSYKSESKTLSADSYHRFSFNIASYNSKVNIKLVTTKNDTEIELSKLEINANEKFEQFDILVHTGSQALDISVKIELDTNGMGYAYIDDAKYDFPKADSSDFENKTESNYTQYINFDDILTSGSNQNLIIGEANNVTTSIVDVENRTISGINPNNEYIQEFKKINSKKVYAIRALSDTYFTAESAIGFSLTTGNCYKISVSVYTQNLSSNDPEKDLEKIGASVGLTNFDNQVFTQIKSDNEWTTYTFYICPEEDVTTYLTFSLGDSELSCKGDAFFGDINFVTKDDDSELPNYFESIKESGTVKVLKETSIITEEDDEDLNEEDGTDEETQTSNSTSSALWYYIPSIIFAIAIVICVVGIMLRKIKWKKHSKKSKSEYDRDKSASKQLYMRKATSLRESKIRELENDLKKAHASRLEYENNYKTNMTKMRELKIKRASQEDIKILEKEIKRNQKLTSAIGVTISKIENELKYVKTDSYLNYLTKKLAYQYYDENESENE